MFFHWINAAIAIYHDVLLLTAKTLFGLRFLLDDLIYVQLLSLFDILHPVYSNYRLMQVKSKGLHDNFIF